VPCELVKTADGWMFVMCMIPKFWQALCKGLGRPQWLEDARFATAASRSEHRAVMSQLLDEAFGAQNNAHWMQQFAGQVPLAPVLDLPQALANPFVQQLGMIQSLPHHTARDAGDGQSGAPGRSATARAGLCAPGRRHRRLAA
jgi:crotonobetainyl-CoA:carnitine CoA-transferase CaiB-like acyl-CoA transferase